MPKLPRRKKLQNRHTTVFLYSSPGNSDRKLFTGFYHNYLMLSINTTRIFFKMADKGESESLAKSREQRKNAGNKMSKLLADEMGDDEFYKTALGGFGEESGDEEYFSEDDQSDQVDSDFSLSETDEIIEQDDDDDGKKKRKKTFYKKPVRPNAEVEAKGEDKVPKENKIKKDKTAVELRVSSRKSTRAATAQSSDKHRKRMEGKKVDLSIFVLESTAFCINPIFPNLFCDCLISLPLP